MDPGQMAPPPAASSMHQSQLIDFLPLGVAAAGLVALVAYSATGPRGSDQFWYVAEVERLVTTGRADTNQVFPNSILEDDSLRAAPVHDILNLHIVAPFGRVLGAYRGWLVANVLASLASALVLAALVARLTSRRLGIAAGAVFLSLPLTVWVTTQPLAEATTAVLVISSVLLFALDTLSPWRWVLLAAVVGLLVWCRESFLPLLILVPVAQAAMTSNRSWRSWSWVAITTIVAGGMGSLQRLLFRPNVPCPLTMRLNVYTAPGISNMNCFTGDPAQTLHVEGVARKMVAHFGQQFLSTGPDIVFFLPFNAAALLAVLHLWRGPPAHRRIAWASVALFATHLATIMVFQNQARYMAPIMPAMVAVGIIFVGSHFPRVQPRSPVPLLVAVVLMLSIASVGAHKARTEGARLLSARAAIRDVLARDVPTSDGILVDYGLPNGPAFGALAEPRAVGMLDPGQSREVAVGLAARIGARWLLSRDDSQLVQALGAMPCSSGGRAPPPWQQVRLFSLVPGLCSLDPTRN